MNKRDFLKHSAAALATTAIAPRLVFGDSTKVKRTNWAGNYTFHTDNLLEPTSASEAQQMVARCNKLRALGTRHSFNSIADSDQNQISLHHLDSMEIDKQARTVKVGAGVTYGKLSPWLDQQGFAVHNLASLPHISVIGGCATATHGSGIRNGNLSTAVVGLEFINAKGELVTLTREKNNDVFDGAVVALGALGIVTNVTLKVEPTFQMTQIVYENLSFNELEKNLLPIMGCGYSVSLFTDWQHHRATQVWIKNRVTPGKAVDMPQLFYSATLQKQKLHPLAGHSAENCTDQQGIPGPWYERMPHFRMNFTPSSGQELQSEFFVPLEDGYKAILAVEKLRDRITPHLFITEIRTIAADDLWISPVRQQPSMAIHFTWKPEWPQVKQVLPHIEEALAPFNARPHWAKLFTMDPKRIQSLYPKLNDFKGIANQYDPQGKFRNDFLQTTLYS